MSDPKPLSRDQLARFLPTQEAIRAFERLFYISGEQTPNLIEQLLQQLGSGVTSPATRSITQPDRRVDDLEPQIAPRMNLHPLELRVVDLEQQQIRPVNLHALILRLEAIEAFLGI